MYHDQEINALSSVYETLKSLNNDQIKRIIDWVTSKFSLDEPEAFKSPGQATESFVEPVKKRRGRTPGKAMPGVEESQPVTTGIKGFMQYDSLKEIFLASTVKRIGAKILLAAAYLQEKENFKELSSYDVSSRLKKIGEEIKNPSVAINALMSKKPPLLLQTGTLGVGLKSRRKFRVTEEGLRVARKYLNE